MIIDQQRIEGLTSQFGFACQYHDRTASTNDDVINWYRQHGSKVVVFAETQSAGRGRRGREWVSPYASNIYCSIGIELSINDRQLALLSLYTGLNLCRSLHQIGYPQVRLKWPNDLLIDRKKLGGILVEVKPLDDGRRLLVIGFGINVLMSEEELAEIGQPSASLAQYDAANPDRTKTLEQLLESLLPALNRYSDNQLSEIVREFALQDAYAGELVEVTVEEVQHRGVNHGINELGQLCLQTDEGMMYYSVGELSLRLSQP